MSEQKQPAFEAEPPDLINKLEAAMKDVKDADYAAAVIAKGIGDVRSLLRAGKAAEAEVKYNETKILIEKAEASVRAEPLAWKLLWVELGYLLFLLVLGYVTHEWPSWWLWAKFMGIYAGTAWFGALGGVTVGLYGLYSHIQARDFDPKYQLWYVCKPIIGAIFGWFVFVVYLVGFVAVQGNAPVTNHLMLYVIAFLAGFSERFTIKIIDRLMQVLTTWEAAPAGSASSSPPAK